jgi:branched-chain amino acid aminotransferase
MPSSLAFDLEPNPRPRSEVHRAAALAEPGFGRVFTDHMVTASYREDRGWYSGCVRAYGPISLDPAASVLHYGQAIFEGFKAYAQPDGGIKTFRPEQNARRFARSAARLAMPVLPEDAFVEAADRLVRQDREWVPRGRDRSLYLRPLMVATESQLGVRPAAEYLFLLFASPASAYFRGGVRPVSVWLCEDYVRAAPGGTGEAKCAGNYAAGLLAQREALEHGCEQVVWLDAVEHRYVEEMGAMNVCFVFASGSSGSRATLVTPPLTGTLLPGVTRDALLTLAADLGIAVEERPMSTEEWADSLGSGEMTEMFACGTGAVITPVGTVRHRGGAWTVGSGKPGPLTMRLRESLLDIQHGVGPDLHGWMHTVV